MSRRCRSTTSCRSSARCSAAPASPCCRTMWSKRMPAWCSCSEIPRCRRSTPISSIRSHEEPGQAACLSRLRDRQIAQLGLLTETPWPVSPVHTPHMKRRSPSSSICTCSPYPLEQKGWHPFPGMQDFFACLAPTGMGNFGINIGPEPVFIRRQSLPKTLRPFACQRDPLRIDLIDLKPYFHGSANRKGAPICFGNGLP